MQVNHFLKLGNVFGFTHQTRRRVYQRNCCIIGLVRIELSNSRLLFIIVCVLKTTRRLLSLFKLIVDPALRPIDPPIDDDLSKPYLDESDIPADSFEVSESGSHDDVTNITAENDTRSLLHSQEDPHSSNQQADDNQVVIDNQSIFATEKILKKRKRKGKMQ